MLEAHIRWLACLRGRKVVEESTERTRDRSPKRSDGTGGTPAKPNDNRGQNGQFQHVETL